MHRSGTSALARVLNLLGADLPSNLLGPAPSNEAGHWESTDLLAIHDELLTSAGSSWDDWGALSPDWCSSAPAETYKLRLLKQLEQDFGNSRFFVIKDPRICRFVPLWLDVLDRFGADTRIVIPIRNPLEVAASLEDRDGFPPAKSYLLWLRHVLDAEEATRNMPRAVVSYDSVIRDWRQVVDEIAQRAKIRWSHSPEQAGDEIDSFLVAQLRHHAADPAALTARPEIVDWLKNTYAVLQDAAEKGDSKVGQRRLDKIRGEFELVSRLFEDVLADNRAQLSRKYEIAREKQAEYDIALRDMQAQFDAGLRENQVRFDNTLRQQQAEFDSALFQKQAQHQAELRGHLDDLRARIQSLVSYVIAGPSRIHSPGALAAATRLYWSGMQRTRHYRRWQYEAIHSSQLFDSAWYLNRYPDLAESGQNPFEHYLRHGAGELRHPHPLFETDSYERVSRGALLGNIRGIFFEDSASERDLALVKNSGLFDSKHYLQHYPDAARSKMDPLLHFMRHGAFEGRDPGPWFSGKWYMWRYPDIERNRINPLLHYLVHGAYEGRDPNPWFSTVDYYSRHPGLAEARINPLVHYVASGSAKIPDNLSSKLLLEGETGRAVKASALTDLIDFPPRDLRPAATSYNPSALDVHWVVPDFAPGGGGMMTILRIVRLLEEFGHRCTVWIAHPHLNRTEQAARKIATQDYQPVRADFKFMSSEFFIQSADALICTSWETVTFGMHATGFKDRFYFVQDYEPAFFPVGSHYLAAEWTYKNDIACICASPWLAEKLANSYGRWTKTCWLAVDRNIYRPLQASRNPNPVPKIAFYARRYTERRAVDLGLLALEYLAKRGVRFHVDFFGMELRPGRLPYSFTDNGVLTEVELARLYQRSDVGIVFSSTNYSLVPQEMMASGLAVLELDCESTRRVYPQEVITLGGPHPIDIAQKLEALLGSSESRIQQAKAALAWVDQFDWETFARTVEGAILERLQAKGFSALVEQMQG